MDFGQDAIVNVITVIVNAIFVVINFFKHKGGKWEHAEKHTAVIEKLSLEPLWKPKKLTSEVVTVEGVYAYEI